MNQSQEQTQTCGNCDFSEETSFGTSMNDIPDSEDVKCSKDGRNYHPTNEACSEWKPKE